MHDWVLWVLVAATGLHVVEEHAFGWQGWAELTLGKRFGAHPSWADFWGTNAALVVFAVSAAAVGWRAAAFALALPALQLINALFFHVLPSLVARRANPGSFTAVLLYVPISVWVYLSADRDGVVDPATLILSVAIGAAVMASAIGFLALKPLFAYPDAASSDEIAKPQTPIPS